MRFILWFRKSSPPGRGWLREACVRPIQLSTRLQPAPHRRASSQALGVAGPEPRTQDAQRAQHLKQDAGVLHLDASREKSNGCLSC